MEEEREGERVECREGEGGRERGGDQTTDKRTGDAAAHRRRAAAVAQRWSTGSRERGSGRPQSTSCEEFSHHNLCGNFGTNKRGRSPNLRAAATGRVVHSSAGGFERRERRPRWRRRRARTFAAAAAGMIVERRKTREVSEGDGDGGARQRGGGVDDEDDGSR